MKVPEKLSYSQLSTYAECGERYKLERGYQLRGGTWYATVAGSAIHTITEKIELQWANMLPGGEEIPTFESAFAEEIRKAKKHGDEIKPSGRVLKERAFAGGPNKKDEAWWLHFGPIFVAKYIEYLERTELELAIMPDGTAGVEVKFEIEVGGEQVVGFIDRVYTDRQGRIIIRDIKTGNEPNGVLQLATYGVGLERSTGLQADIADYFLPSWNKDAGEVYWRSAKQIHLEEYRQEYVDYLYGAARKGIDAGVFLPNVTMLCKGCGVRDFCRAVGGESARRFPIIEEVEHRKSELTAE